MEYNQVTEEMAAKLRASVTGTVYTGAEISEDYSHDEYEVHGHFMPEAVVVVKSTEDVSAVCRICYEYEVPFLVRGAGTGLAGGCVPIAGGVVIDMQKMNQILGIHKEDQVIRVQAGALIQDLQAACLEEDMIYPPDPGEKLATVGGNVATNAGGMRACKYGSTRDWVLAMTVVMPRGDIMEFGAEVSKSASGYSLMNLISGSEGTLGIITELSMKIAPRPAGTISLLAPFADVETCISCVASVKNANLDPQCLEFMDRSNVDAVHHYLKRTVFPTEMEGTQAGAYLLVNFEIYSDEEAEGIMERAAEVFLENGALDVVVYDTPAALHAAWEVRGSVLEAILEDFDLTDEVDIVVPVSKLAEYIIYCQNLEVPEGMEIRLAGHAGNGNLHVSVCAKDMEQGEFEEKIRGIFDLLYQKGIELKGCVSGEHGIGSANIDRLEQFLGKPQMELMTAIKQACDPKMLLNPGKVCFSL